MESLTQVGGLLVLALVCVAGLASLVIGMPGTFVILGASIVGQHFLHTLCLWT